MKEFREIDIDQESKLSGLKCFQNVYQVDKPTKTRRWLIGFFLLLILIMLLPWTQNIRGTGTVTTLRQEQRPQELNTVIAGRVIKWHVKEGDFVKQGDTILQLGEVKVDYFDPKLLDRTAKQIEAKQQGINGYRSRAGTAESQVLALQEAKIFKLQSLDNKIQQQSLKLASDSADLIAVNNELQVYSRQIEAAQTLLDSGAISLTDFERRKLSFQNGLAKKIGAENKLMNARQELTNLFIEKNSTVQDYADKIAKAEGDKFGSLSNLASTEAEVAKLENLYSSYEIRNELYFINAPQDGQVVKAMKAGIGEMLKEGDMIVEIVPNNIQYAVEMFVSPMDLPLVAVGQKVRFVFDGFPAIVFSGWPQSSYGTFGGTVSAVESSVSTNGKFRVLVIEDPKEKKWPEALKQGGGASGIALLKDVPVIYELWRNINGFPPQYYKPEQAVQTKQ